MPVSPCSWNRDRPQAVVGLVVQQVRSSLLDEPPDALDHGRSLLDVDCGESFQGRTPLLQGVH